MMNFEHYTNLLEKSSDLDIERLYGYSGYARRDKPLKSSMELVTESLNLKKKFWISTNLITTGNRKLNRENISRYEYITKLQNKKPDCKKYKNYSMTVKFYLVGLIGFLIFLIPVTIKKIT